MRRRHPRPLLAAVVFAVLFAQVLVYPGVDVLVAAYGATDRANASMLFLAIEFAAFVLAAPLWGAASDAIGRRVPFIVASAVAGAIGYFALATLPFGLDWPFEAVLLLRAAQGAVTIGAFSLGMTMLMDLDGGHGRNMGAAGIAIGLGTATGAPIGGFLYDISPRAPLMLAGGLLVGVAGLAVVLEDRGRRGRRRAGAILAAIQGTPDLLLPYTFGFLDRLTAGFFALVGTLYFREVHGLDPGATGIMLGLFFAPFALLQYPFGVLSDRIGRALPVVAGSATYGLAVIGVGLAGTVPVAGIGMIVVGVLGALMAPATMALVTDLSGRTERGVTMAGFNAAGSIGFLVGIVVGGSIAQQYGFLAAFVVVGGLETAVALVAIPAFTRLDVARTATFSREDR